MKGEIGSRNDARTVVLNAIAPMDLRPPFEVRFSKLVCHMSFGYREPASD